MEFFAISNNIPVFISDTKKGDQTLVLLHGYLETHYIFSEFAESLSKKYRVISIDLPGHGLSGSNDDANSMEFSAAVVVDVMDKCKVEKAFVAGHSMGGYVAQACYEAYPERFKGLILLNSVPFPDSEEKKADREREISLIQSSMLGRIAELSIPRMYDSESLRKFDDKIQETIELCETHDPKGIVASLRGMMQRKDYTDFVKSLKAPASPALFVFGDKDKFNPIGRVNEIIAQFPNIESKIVENSGHNSFIEQPDKTLEIVSEFVERYK